MEINMLPGYGGNARKPLSHIEITLLVLDLQKSG